jgi:hypothetical protein
MRGAGARGNDDRHDGNVWPKNHCILGGEGEPWRQLFVTACIYFQPQIGEDV